MIECDSRVLLLKLLAFTPTPNPFSPASHLRGLVGLVLCKPLPCDELRGSTAWTKSFNIAPVWDAAAAAAERDAAFTGVEQAYQICEAKRCYGAAFLPSENMDLKGTVTSHPKVRWHNSSPKGGGFKPWNLEIPWQQRSLACSAAFACQQSHKMPQATLQ